MDRELLGQWRITPEARHYLYLQQVSSAALIRVCIDAEIGVWMELLHTGSIPL